MRLAFAICGMILTVSLVVAAMHDTRREWQPIQDNYKSIAISKATDERLKEAADRVTKEVKQDFIPTLRRTDRCRSCHLGVDNPSMEGAEQPHGAHPGNLLESHPPEKFGCTVCHHGQGLATTAKAAHANAIEFWEEPMLKGGFIEATCEHCHRGENIAEAPLLADGRVLFNKKGCAGCHKVYGKGGMLGPELTNLGKVSPHLKHPVEENREAYLERTHGNVNLAYILESIEEPLAQPEETTMPEYELSKWEVRAMTVYVKGLNDADLPAVYMAHSNPAELTGKELFVRYCSACHGKTGQGGLHIGRMGTALNNEDFLSLASPELITGIVRQGRNSHNKVMPSWHAEAGGLAEDEIEAVVEYVLSWKDTPRDIAELMAAGGSLNTGHGLYQRVCGDCHGVHREGHIGPSLRSKELFQIASTRLLYETLEEGRPGTAMPAWRGYDKAQLSSLVMFLLAHNGQTSSVSDVNPNGDPEEGESVFLSNCATCHGRDGSGGIGPSLNSGELVTLASHNYFAATITDGRPDSGMPSWSTLSAEQLSDTVAYVRNLAAPVELRDIPTEQGVASDGKEIFTGVCGQCHGPSGEGGTGPAIGASDFTKLTDNQFLAGMIKYGRTGTEMRPHGQVPSALADYTDEEIADIVAYIRTLGAENVIRQTIRGSVDAGEEWYNRLCVNCHGKSGRGGIGPALSNPAFLSVASDGFLQAQMALGRTDTEMRPMTPYAGGIVEVGRATLNDIIAYIRQESTTYGKGTVQTAYGSVLDGEIWFISVCSKCHGIDGKGTSAAPGLNDANFLSFASDGFLQGTIIRGRMHTGMRSFGEHGDGIASLTAKDVTDIATYIRFWVDPRIGPAFGTEISTNAQDPSTAFKQDIEE